MLPKTVPARSTAGVQVNILSEVAAEVLWAVVVVSVVDRVSALVTAVHHAVTAAAVGTVKC